MSEGLESPRGRGEKTVDHGKTVFVMRFQENRSTESPGGAGDDRLEMIENALRYLI